jgi:putative transposase
VTWGQETFQVSQRRACGTFGVARSSVCYRSIRPTQEPLRARIREITSVRVSYGYRRVHVLLRREGWKVNSKRIHRLYRDEGLALRSKKPKRRRAVQTRQERPAGTLPNERWSMDFMSDALADGRKLRVLTVLDTCTRECVALEVETNFGGQRVADVLTRVGVQRGLPATITVDNGTEFTSRALDHWAYRNQLKLDYTRPGKPTDNGFIESFNARVRSECLSQHYFSSVEDARLTLRAWRDEYNYQRPHSALGQRTPAEVGAEARRTMTQESRTIAIVDPAASCEAVLERTEVVITEDQEELALRRA